MNLRVSILLVVALFAFLGANASAYNGAGVGSVIARVGSGQQRLPRKQRHERNYAPNHSPRKVTTHTGVAEVPPRFVPVTPCPVYTKTSCGQRLPLTPPIARKRFLELRVILV